MTPAPRRQVFIELEYSVALDWSEVLSRLRMLARVDDMQENVCDPFWRSGQDASLAWIADRLQERPGVLVADEVGLGKTRLAIALAVCVASCGGRVAFMVPPGLIAQWREDELGAFLKQFDALPSSRRLPWMEAVVSPGCTELKTYRDLFPRDGGKAVFPVSARAPFVFISHRFGVPLRLGGQSRDERWGLPFALKGRIFDGRTVSGAHNLDLSNEQKGAIDWLARRLSLQKNAKLKARLKEADLGVVAGQSLKIPENELLFQHLIGKLVGDFDLIVIDEAHKNRRGAELADVAGRATNGGMRDAMSSRMSACLNHILLRPGASTKSAKRLVMTATPMEMDAGQWSAILHRVGLESGEIKRLSQVAMTFSDAVAGLTVGSTSQVSALKAAAEGFQLAYANVVTRRLWRDHPDVQRFSEATGRTGLAHPHRRFLDPHTVRLAELDQPQRELLAHAECLAVASRGIETEQALKTAGARSSQGLPLWSEKAIDADDPAFGGELSGSSAAKQKRQAYWLQRLRHADVHHEDGTGREKAAISLQWHPRIKAAVELIEALTGSHEKVLVFGEFLEPMRALNRALNIRHYLRHVLDGQPIALPTGLHPEDPDIRRWMKDEEFDFSDDKIAEFPQVSLKLSEKYHQGRVQLLHLCREEVRVFLGAPDSDREAVLDDAGLEGDVQGLTNWLVQCLIVGSDADAGFTPGSVRALLVRERARALLAAVCDADPTEFIDDADALSDALSSRRKAVQRHLAEEADPSDGKVGSFRISPFSQLLYGDTKPGTRRVRQRAFNDAAMHPKVLIGQAAVASEGLNLHQACRNVVLFHLDWNPGRIEQQIGRVDRQGSHWMNAFAEWTLKREGEAPTIDIHTLSIEGSYDALRTAVVRERAKVLRSQLFGEILPPEALSQLPANVRDEIGQIKIDFTPQRVPG